MECKEESFLCIRCQFFFFFGCIHISLLEMSRVTVKKRKLTYCLFFTSQLTAGTFAKTSLRKVFDVSCEARSSGLPGTLKGEPHSTAAGKCWVLFEEERHLRGQHPACIRESSKNVLEEKNKSPLRCRCQSQNPIQSGIRATAGEFCSFTSGVLDRPRVREKFTIAQFGSRLCLFSPWSDRAVYEITRLYSLQMSKLTSEGSLFLFCKKESSSEAQKYHKTRSCK